MCINFFLVGRVYIHTCTAPVQPHNSRPHYLSKTFIGSVTVKLQINMEYKFNRNWGYRNDLFLVYLFIFNFFWNFKNILSHLDELKRNVTPKSFTSFNNWDVNCIMQSKFTWTHFLQLLQTCKVLHNQIVGVLTLCCFSSVSLTS